MIGGTPTTRAGGLAKELKPCHNDPLGYVMFAFPWDTDPAIQMVKLAAGVDDRLTAGDLERQAAYRARFPNCEYGPDLWACDFLTELQKNIIIQNFDGHTAVDPIMFATASGHGIGKSVMVAWLIKFILDTRPYSKGVVTAGTADQLKTKTWAELGKWHRISITESWFKYTSGRGAMVLKHRKWGEEWNCIAHTCREENSESFAGLHAANATPFFIFDEGSGVPDAIYGVRDGGTTDGAPMIFDFGNPTRNSGRFFEQCAGELRHRYIVRCIDSRDVAITNKSRIQDWVDDYGEDSDYVKVRVRGVFPSRGAVQFIPTGDVLAAQARELVEDRFSPMVLGVDVARFGDDESVIYPRKGSDARSWPARRYRGLDTAQFAGKVIEQVQEFKNIGIKVAAIFVDGGGIGGGVVDQLRHLGYPVVEVQFGGTPVDNLVYRYKGDELWGDMRDHIRRRLCLPANHQENGTDLRRDLTQREFGYTTGGDKIHLEPKKLMKERLGPDSSPDIGDALALTFAQELAPEMGLVRQNQLMHEYDPHAPEQFQTLVRELPDRYLQNRERN